jgi:site-specific DNA-methyltransferase (adenine-specific)
VAPVRTVTPARALALELDQVLIGDCLSVLPSLPDACVDLVVTDPPFNIGLAYAGYDDSRSSDEFLAGLEAAFTQAKRLLRPAGSLWVAMGPRLQARVFVLLEDLGFHWRNTIVWYYGFGPHQKRKFTPCYTPIHYFVKDPDRFTFNADAVRVPSVRQLKYNDKRAKAGGKTPDDVWLLDLGKAEANGHFDSASDAWHVPRVAGTFKERAGHVCQMPVAVLERVIAVASNPGDLVLDFYAGTGTTLVAAKKLGRHYLGVELCKETAALAEGRLDKPAKGYEKA